MKDPAKVLVTGGAGMIGRRVVAQLHDLGVETAVLDNLTSGLPMPQTASLAIAGDIRNAELVDKTFRDFRPEAILHLAAVHHIPTCETQRAYCLDVNVTGTENVLWAAENAGIRRLTLASSGAVYAWENTMLNEDSTPLWACDNYALAKTCNESQLRFWTQRTGGMGRVARIFNTIADDDPNAHLIPDISAQLRDGKANAEIRLGNLASKRDYIHADDAAAGLIALLRDTRLTTPYDVFNICTGHETSVEELVREIASVLGRGIHIVTDPARRRKIDRPNQLGNPGKARLLLNWTAGMSFGEALSMTISPSGNDKRR
ncbi:NAD-dependent epimerase/dehydratase family protein [Methylomonas methanica]|uniref:UDP-glucose 4-epimerase n=1 Tax=Methylomonas methanica (strain DSM 25384 / MC09) TaxID=857087 RepID=F9ZW39_METMM|nr:NAD(P)-dependent oxidoreductase [Methylomonas methanica]AEG02010.1 UDP-glucose 4-epimerase [Methylomonas methanica MC09]